MSDEYTCSSCGEEFIKGWSDEEADEERRARFPCMPLEEMVMVCDDCWKAMGLANSAAG